jgi:hypothetical protein
MNQEEIRDKFDKAAQAAASRNVRGSKEALDVRDAIETWAKSTAGIESHKAQPIVDSLERLYVKGYQQALSDFPPATVAERAVIEALLVYFDEELSGAHRDDAARNFRAAVNALKAERGLNCE